MTAALAAVLLPPWGMFAAARTQRSFGDPVPPRLDAMTDAVDARVSDVSSPLQEDSDERGDLPSSPHLLDGAHERVAPRFLNLSCGRDGLPEASLLSKLDPEQDREELRPRMGRRKRLAEMSADGRDPSRRLQTAHRDSAHAHARREILLL